MSGRMTRSFRGDDSAAIAPLYALALFALIGAGGIAFDYARLAAMDSELQSAADQAALAAATQLDGRANAITRAQGAANNYLAQSGGTYVNKTLFANDGSGSDITSLSFTFYEGYDSSADTFDSATTTDADAAVVEVTVNTRTAFYALTPIVGALSSGGITAKAVAGLQSATCNVPPMMFCSPSNSFPADSDVGKGMLLHMKAQQADVWAPGNFGYLDIDYVYPESGNPNTTLGRNTDLLGCVGEAVESRTGNRTPEMKALNTRFDQYASGTPSCNSGTGSFCPAQDVRRNEVSVQKDNRKFDTLAELESQTSCAASPANNDSWVQIADLTAALSAPSPQGLPRDTAFGSGNYTNFGSGAWDGPGYMAQHHGTTLLSSVPDLDGNGSRSRYEVYMWEKASASRMTSKRVGYDARLKNGKYDQVEIYCSYPEPKTGTPVVPSTTQKDRRVMTVASVDCGGLSGHAQVNIIKWVDMFLVEPANLGGSDQTFFAEVKGPAEKPGGGSGFQYFGRNKPVLLR